MTTALLVALLAMAGQRPSAPPDSSHPVIPVGRHDELWAARAWGPLAMENKAHVSVPKHGRLFLWLDHVPEGWPYTFQWSGVTRDARVDLARFPVLMARVEQVKGYAHLDIDVLDAAGKSVKTLRSSTLNDPGISTIDLSKALDPAVYSLRLRLIVGGDNTGCSATYDWVRFVSPADAPFLIQHPDYTKVREVRPSLNREPDYDAMHFEVIEVAVSSKLAALNDDGMIAGIRRDPLGKGDAFVWQRGKTIWHEAGYTRCAGPNHRGQVALGNDKGLFLWEQGNVRPCPDPEIVGGGMTGTIPQQILGIDDSGTIVATSEGFDGAFTIFSWPASKHVEVPMPPGIGGNRFVGFWPTAVGPDGSAAGISPWVAIQIGSSKAAARSTSTTACLQAPIGFSSRD